MAMYIRAQLAVYSVLYFPRLYRCRSPAVVSLLLTG